VCRYGNSRWRRGRRTRSQGAASYPQATRRRQTERRSKPYCAYHAITFQHTPSDRCRQPVPIQAPSKAASSQWPSRTIERIPPIIALGSNRLRGSPRPCGKFLRSSGRIGHSHEAGARPIAGFSDCVYRLFRQPTQNLQGQPPRTGLPPRMMTARQSSEVLWEDPV
jgi:hypothetical protein